MDIDITFGGEVRYLNDLLFDLFEAKSLESGTRKEIPGGAVITLKPMEMKKGAAFPGVVELVLSFGVGVSSSLVAAYIYDKLKANHAKGIRTIVDRREIRVTKSGLVKIIEEHIEREEKR